MARTALIRTRHATLKGNLTERARRLFVANETIAFGYGSIMAAARATGMAPSAIGRGMADARASEDGPAPRLAPARSRRPGGGRKLTTVKDPMLFPDLKALVESMTRDDPESPLLWTARSQRNLLAAPAQQDHHTSMKMVAPLLNGSAIACRPIARRLEGAQHPDRNAQFEHLNEVLCGKLRCGSPAISLDRLRPRSVHGGAVR